MLPRSNIHTHTCFSDGRDTAEQMVQAALERGFVSLGFSDHGAAPYDAAAMHTEADYRAEVLRLREQYAGRIEIALGYEHDYHAFGADLSPYEYAIESVHFMQHGGELRPIDSSADILASIRDDWFAGDPFAMCRDYFDSVCRSIMTSSAEIVGHIGLISKFNEGNAMFDSSDPRYLNPAREAIRCAVERGRIVEINTGAMSRGYRSAPYPDAILLRDIHDLGGRITISSDAHRADWIDFAFDQAIALAQSSSFRTAWIWKDGGMAEVEL